MIQLIVWYAVFDILKENGVYDQINKNVIIYDNNDKDCDKSIESLKKIKIVKKKKFDIIENEIKNDFEAKGRDIYFDDTNGHAQLGDQYKLKKK